MMMMMTMMMMVMVMVMVILMMVMMMTMMTSIICTYSSQCQGDLKWCCRQDCRFDLRLIYVGKRQLRSGP
eukprot:901752-Karenia_brevis.AAC.1